MDPSCHIELLGGLRVDQDGRTITRFRTQKTALLLAYLACHIKRTHAREELVELLWPDVDPEAGRTSLRTALASLRRQLEPPGIPEDTVILADRLHLRLNPQVVTTDLGELEAALQEAARSDDSVVRIQLLTRAADLHRGPLLPGFYEDWVMTERERLEQVFARTLGQLSAAYEETGDLARAIEYAQRLVAADPLVEENHRHLMRLYAAFGKPSEGLRQFRHLERILREELDETPSMETRTLAERLAQARDMPSGSSASPALAEASGKTVVARRESTQPAEQQRAAAPPSRLPFQLTRFFGRQEEIAQIEGLIEPDSPSFSRLVTVTGLAGAGKTRLAVEVAQRVAQSYEGAVWFVPLADTTDSDLVMSEVVRALGLRPAAGQEPIQKIVESLGDRPGLVILDNFEQLLDDGALAVWELLQRIPHLTVLVTSRQRLDLGGEREFAISPLPIPPIPDDPERLLEFPSVQLFIDRAQSARPDFQMTAANAPAIAALCERLEGVPLAIELAAAWSPTLTPSQMLARLERRFDLLASRRKDLSARHRTLRAAIEWSYRLLTPELQRFFAALSVFRGGWTLQAAETVCGEPLALDYLTELRARSLILIDEGVDEMRYRMLETLREYAADQLAEEDHRTLFQEHAEYYLAQARQFVPDAKGLEMVALLDRLEAEQDNIRVLLERSLEGSVSPQTGLRICRALNHLWYVRGHVHEGYRWTTELLEKADAPEEGLTKEQLVERGRAYYDAGALANALGDYESARGWFERSLTLCRETEDMPGIGSALCFLGLADEELGNYAASRALFDQSLAVWRLLKDKGGTAHLLKCVGADALAQGDLELAQRMFDEGMSLYREMGNDRGIDMMLGELGRLAVAMQDYGRAESLFNEHLAMARQLKDTIHTIIGLSNHGDLTFRRGDYATARAFLEESLALCRSSGKQADLALTLSHLGHTALRMGDPAEARCYYQECQQILRGIDGRRGAIARMYILELAFRFGLGEQIDSSREAAIRGTRLIAALESVYHTLRTPPRGAQRADLDRSIAALRAKLDDATFQAAWDEGQSMSLEQAIVYTLSPEEIAIS